MGSCELRRLISQKTRNEAFVKNKAELVVLAANARIGGRNQADIEGEQASISHGWDRHSHTSRLRLQKIPRIQRGLQIPIAGTTGQCRPFLPVRVFYLSKLGFFLH